MSSETYHYGEKKNTCVEKSTRYLYFFIIYQILIFFYIYQILIFFYYYLFLYFLLIFTFVTNEISFDTLFRPVWVLSLDYYFDFLFILFLWTFLYLFIIFFIYFLFRSHFIWDPIMCTCSRDDNMRWHSTRITQSPSLSLSHTWRFMFMKRKVDRNMYAFAYMHVYFYALRQITSYFSPFPS